MLVALSHLFLSNIDDTGLKGQYILTGSSSQKIETAHTGTLRISTLKMYPMIFILIEAMTLSIKNILHITDEKVEGIYRYFFFRLPEYMQDALTCNYKVA